jgi:hypothetical protein
MMTIQHRFPDDSPTDSVDIRYTFKVVPIRSITHQPIEDLQSDPVTVR